MTVFYQTYKTKFGIGWVAWDENGVIQRSSLPSINESVPEGWFWEEKEHPVCYVLKTFFEQGVDIPPLINLNWDLVTPFQRKVFRECQKIPYGKTASYKELAKRIRAPHASRAI